jgi:2-dehydro-3-deoxyphosphogluconate aldolase/(4S)-4-hydroxy-2-oxoglutarate aldolase
MTAYSRLAVLNRLVGSGLLPLFHHEDLAVAQRILDACVIGGAGVIEFTNRGDGAWRTFVELLAHRRQRGLDVMLGVGSVVDAETAALYANNGADFVVGPTFNAAIAALCNRRKVA